MKKLFSLLTALALVITLSACSNVLEPTQELVTSEVDAAEEAILESIADLKDELTKEPETIEVEVIVKELTYDLCIVNGGSPGGGNLLLPNATVIEKPFTTIIDIEYDGLYGRETKPFDVEDVQINCTNTYKKE